MRPSVQVVLALAYLTLMFGAAVYFVVITHRLAQIAGGSVGFWSAGNYNNDRIAANDVWAISS